ncbi:hypothetical protein N5J43_30010 [Pseudomonas nicosulfuronedens]|uniref:Sel1 repeat family protein n=1 Tax=Pseudomonas nicosulfuronedens TaxID=2571105 RepID=A0A5R9R516_9PSED|nr:hypothetical protein [Pseudomonas nicosulfuronedens]MDH1012783.1 hypothetical protein [Pseudomonas nicosulfuronedens]MDH1983212.1 hypothetical protein [Pseudomonas nicosulfuronedens]MDH2026111.1 hypothetical protein [Pseudomonas nicosulfuronedens]TLX77843.1 hypothetical protein FAS41_11835 [Pseudomonas nicosulfuronedens]
MRTLNVSSFIFGLAFHCSPVFASSPSPAAEQHYEQARSSLEQARQMLADSKGFSAGKLEVVIDSANAELQKATELGHPAAAFYQAQLILNMRSSDTEKRSQACSLLETWAEKGFVAAAVMNFRKCDRSYLRFDDASPEHQAALGALSSSLAGGDPAQAYYPFPQDASQCFGAGSTETVALSQAQFRAEAEYILGSAQQPEDTETAKRLVAWLDDSANHGCQMPMDPRPFLRKLSGNQ